MDHIEGVRKTFDHNSERYEDWFSREEGKIIKETEKRAITKLIPEGKGLEVGVGSGIFAFELGVDYGIDPAGEMLALACSRGVKTVRGIAEMLPFRNSSFDFLLFIFTISFLADIQKAFGEAERALVQDGKMIVCFVPKESPWGRLYREKRSEGHEFYKHVRFYSPREVETLLEKSGFRKTREVSTLFQRPGSVEEVEDPVEGAHEPAGFRCFEAVIDR